MGYVIALEWGRKGGGRQQAHDAGCGCQPRPRWLASPLTCSWLLLKLQSRQSAEVKLERCRFWPLKSWPCSGRVAGRSRQR